MRFFSGNLLSGKSAEEVESVESVATVETEEETAQRLLVEENTDLKRKLALQNQSFTAQQIEDAEGAETVASEQNAQTQTASIPSSPPARQAPRPAAPVTRPAVAPRPPVPARTAAPVRPTPAPRAVAPARPAPTPVVRASARPPVPEPMNLAQIAAAGNYGEMPSAPMASSAAILQPVSTTSRIPTGITVANRTTQALRSGSVPVSLRRQQIPAASGATSTVSETVERPRPMVMRDLSVSNIQASNIQTVTQPSMLVAQASDTYEAQRSLIMGESALLDDVRSMPSSILPGSTADLEVVTAVTWASDLPKALGTLMLTSSLISDGVEVMPEGTELIVQIGDLSASGAVSLDVVAMVLPGSTEATEINISAGAVSILAAAGGYPVARAEQSSEQQLQAIDRQQALLSAIGSVGDYLNRPERETNVIGLGGSSSSREYGSGSLIGSLLSGAANGMLRSRAARLNAEADKLIDRPTIWSIESGRQLQLFVTQEISL